MQLIIYIEVVCQPLEQLPACQKESAIARMKERKEITIYDIAKSLNISAATVSRSLQNHQSISSATRTLVHEMAKEMGYRSNTFARNLRQQRTHTLGLIVPRLNSYVISTIIAGIEKVVNEHGYNIIISQSQGSVKKELSNINMMFDSRVDGLLVSLAYGAKSIANFKSFFDKNIPVVFFDRVCTDPHSFNVVIDNYKSAYDITKHLIEQGCRRIMHIAGELSIDIYAERLRGYKQALQDSGLYASEDMVVISGLTDKAGTEIGRQILQMSQRPDGIFAASDVCAAYCLQTLKESGVQIPREIAVAGFNNDPVSRIVEPNLTTVEYPCFEMGEVSAKCLVDHLSGSRTVDHANTIVLRSKIIIRESSLKLKE
jgi:LacI family transcriptional regulator